MPIGMTLAIPQLTPFHLPPDIGALFAAGAGVLFINATNAEAGLGLKAIDPSRRSEISSDIRHETYHLLQTVCTGYCFVRAQKIKEKTLEHAWRSVQRDFRANRWSYLELMAYHLLPRSIGDQFIDVPRVKIFRRMLADVAERAPSNDYSLAGADVPELFEELESIEREFKNAAKSGISAWHIVEGTASVAQILAETASRTAEERDDAIIRGLKRLDIGYSVAYAICRSHFGQRAGELFLPAAALALRYEKPGEAILPLSALLDAGAAPGEETYFARFVGDKLPDLSAAGKRLGTAVNVWSRARFRFWKRRHTFYRPQLDYLARRLKLFDEISVLCEQFDDLPDELIHVIVRTKDNIGGVGPRVDAEVARGRLQLAAIQLRLDGRPRWERNIQTEINEFARETIQQLFGMANAARGRDEKDTPPQAN
jgi:hypothetical protein